MQRIFDRPIVIIGLLFFVFGFVTWLGSVLIPYLRIACELNNFESYLVAFAFYISYTVMAVPAGMLLKFTGFKKGMALGLLLMALGTLIFLPAALTRIYALFLTGLFVQGMGLAVLQTAANPYITILGPRESAARRISVMGICNGVAGITGPLILGAVILRDADRLQEQLGLMSPVQKAAALDQLAGRVIVPYLLMFAALILLAIWVYCSALPEIKEEEESLPAGHSEQGGITRFPHLLLGVFTLFLYVGVEVIAGDTIIGYGAWQGVSLSTARLFTSCTLGGMLAGYVVGIVCIPRYFSQQQALTLSAVLGVSFTLGALCTDGYVSVAFIALLGLANSLMWPSIWPLALNGLGRFTRMGSSLLIMGIGGGALLPLLYGRLADLFDPRLAYWMVIPCYLVIFLYAVWGHKIRAKKVVPEKVRAL